MKLKPKENIFPADALRVDERLPKPLKVTETLQEFIAKQPATSGEIKPEDTTLRGKLINNAQKLEAAVPDSWEFLPGVGDINDYVQTAATLSNPHASTLTKAAYIAGATLPFINVKTSSRVLKHAIPSTRKWAAETSGALPFVKTKDLKGILSDVKNYDDFERLGSRDWYTYHVGPNVRDGRFIGETIKSEHGINMRNLVESYTPEKGNKMIFDAIDKNTNNFDRWIDGRKLVGLPTNMSGHTKPELGRYAAGMSDDYFVKTTTSPASGRHLFINKHTAPDIDIQPLTHQEYEDYVNNNLDDLNEFIAEGNSSGVPYKVTKIEDGRIHFDSEKGPSVFNVDITPGKTTQPVPNVLSEDAYKAYPGISMRDAGRTVFGDMEPRRGTGFYKSFRAFQKKHDLGSIKSGFNWQTMFSKGLWEDLIMNRKAIGHYASKDRVDAIMYGLLPFIGVKAVSENNK